VGNVYRDERSLFCGYLDRGDDVLRCLPSEDRVREASSSFDINSVDLDDIYAQNGFHNHDLDGLQYQFRYADKVSPASKLVIGSKLNLSSVLGTGMTISVNHFLRNLSLSIFSHIMASLQSHPRI